MTPDIICKIARRAGCTATIADEDAAPGTSLIRLRRKGVAVDVVLGDDVGNERYGSGFVGTPNAPRGLKRVAGAAVREQLPGLKPDAWRVGTTLMFDGGVTLQVDREAPPPGPQSDRPLGHSRMKSAWSLVSGD